jgi:hypothetical protein
MRAFEPVETSQPVVVVKQPLCSRWIRMKRSRALLFAASALCLCSQAGSLPPIRTVFLILMENTSWGDIHDNTSAPYINNVLLPMASHCESYSNIPNLHPSLPNYLWIESGTNFGITDDNDPVYDHQGTANHLVTLLKQAGISWRAYQEHITTNSLPLSTCCGWSSRHNPFLYFDDVTGTNNPYDPYGLAHIRPYSELAADLTNNTVASYNFIIPDDCHNMHDVCALGNATLQGDTWLSQEVPKILGSQAFATGGALFIAFDESYSADTRLTFIALSPFARGGGYGSFVAVDHSSLLRTLQEIFNVTPYLGAASTANNLSDLFLVPGTDLQISGFSRLGPDGFRLSISGLFTNVPFYVQASSKLLNWSDVSTNVATNVSCELLLTNSFPTGFSPSFYRIRQTSP